MQLCFSSSSALNRGGWSTPRPGRFAPWKETRYPLYSRVGGPQGRSGRVCKISPLTVFDPRTVQPVASRSRCSTSDCATTSTKQRLFSLYYSVTPPWDRYSVVDYAVDWTVWVSVPGRECSLLQNVQSCSGALGFVFIVYRGSLCGVKWPQPEVDHSSPSSVDLKNELSYTSTSSIAFMVWTDATLLCHPTSRRCTSCSF